MARGSSRGPGSSPRRSASSRPAPRARTPRQAASGKAASGKVASGKVAEQAANGWRERLNAARANRRAVRRVGLGVVLLFLVILVAPTLRAYLQQQSDISSLRDRVAQQKVTVEELQDEQARWEDPAYVEQQARTRLKFVKVGEKSYTVIDPKVDKRDATVVARAGESADPWYDTIWSSMQAADVPANQRR